MLMLFRDIPIRVDTSDPSNYYERFWKESVRKDFWKSLLYDLDKTAKDYQEEKKFQSNN